MSRLALTVSCRKSYSSSMGYSSSLHLFLTSCSKVRPGQKSIKMTHVDLSIVDFKSVNIIVILFDFILIERRFGK
jgi:hypothetical protein